MEDVGEADVKSDDDKDASDDDSDLFGSDTSTNGAVGAYPASWGRTFVMLHSIRNCIY